MGKDFFSFLDFPGERRTRFLRTLYTFNTFKVWYGPVIPTDLDSVYTFNDILDLTPELKRRIVVYTQRYTGPGRRSFGPAMFMFYLLGIVFILSFDWRLAIPGLFLLILGCYCSRKIYLQGKVLMEDLAKISDRNRELIETEKLISHG